MVYRRAVEELAKLAALWLLVLLRLRLQAGAAGSDAAGGDLTELRVQVACILRIS